MDDTAKAETISCHFNPPSIANFGDIWESSIKSVKTNLFRLTDIDILRTENIIWPDRRIVVHCHLSVMILTIYIFLRTTYKW